MNEFTPQELEAYLENTSLPTLVVEGVSDVKIYRSIETYLNSNGFPDVSLLSAGGRSVVFNLSEKRLSLARVPIVFIADKDAFYFTGIPAEHQSIVFTHGYAVENDVYAEGEIIKLMDTNELAKYNRIKGLLIEWYSTELAKLRSSGSWDVGCNINSVIDCASMIFKRPIAPEADLINEISGNYLLSVRGKNLIELAAVILSDKSRGHDKYSKENIVAMSLAYSDRNLLLALTRRVADRFNEEYAEYPIAR